MGDSILQDSSILQTEEWKARIKKWEQPLEAAPIIAKDDLSEYLDTKLY
jgi:hypothetical protein